jgi:membrane protein insertase Oxa1/YidC/SpoIIIJ
LFMFTSWLKRKKKEENTVADSGTYVYLIVSIYLNADARSVHKVRSYRNNGTKILRLLLFLGFEFFGRWIFCISDTRRHFAFQFCWCSEKIGSPGVSVVYATHRNVFVLPGPRSSGKDPFQREVFCSCSYSFFLLSCVYFFLNSKVRANQKKRRSIFIENSGEGKNQKIQKIFLIFFYFDGFFFNTFF